MIVCIAMIDCPSDDLKQQRAVMHREKEGEKDVESHTKRQPVHITLSLLLSVSYDSIPASGSFSAHSF